LSSTALLAYEHCQPRGDFLNDFIHLNIGSTGSGFGQLAAFDKPAEVTARGSQEKQKKK